MWQVASVLLPLCFLYDIFWVFLQPLLLGGPSVMVEACTLLLIFLGTCAVPGVHVRKLPPLTHVLGFQHLLALTRLVLLTYCRAMLLLGGH